MGTIYLKTAVIWALYEMVFFFTPCKFYRSQRWMFSSCTKISLFSGIRWSMVNVPCGFCRARQRACPFFTGSILTNSGSLNSSVVRNHIMSKNWHTLMISSAYVSNISWIGSFLSPGCLVYHIIILQIHCPYRCVVFRTILFMYGGCE